MKMKSRMGLVAATVLVAFFTAEVAWAQGGAVRYSYEEVRVAGDREFVLVPVAEGTIRGEVNTQMVEQTFERLRQAKRSTYGNSYANVRGQLPNRATVEVHIAANARSYAPIIIAESVYTLTEMGIPEVHFPGVVEGGLTRADVPFAAYSLTVPLWKVVPPGPLTTAQVRMPDDTLVPVSEVQAQWRSDRATLVDGVYSYLESGVEHTVRSVLRVLPELGELQVAKVTPLLTHSSARVRQEALGALEGQENNGDVLQGVAAALAEESNQTLAKSMAEFLGSSRDAQYRVLQPMHLVDHGSDEEAQAAVTALQQFGEDARAVEKLSEALRDERDAVATAAAESLEALGSHEPRVAALGDGDVDGAVRLQMAQDLAGDGKPAAVRLAGYQYIASNRSEGHANQAIAAMATLPIPAAREAVEVFLTSDSRGQRLAAAAALRERGDIEAAPALLSASESQPETQLLRDAAYQLMVAQPWETILEQTRASSVAVQELAYQAVGERGSAQGGNDVLSTIQTGASHRSAAIRGASALALGELGTDPALEVLSGMTGDSSAEVRRKVALALGSFSDAHADTLEGYLDDGDPGVVAASIDAMEQREDARAAERIRGMVGHDNHLIRGSAIRAATTFLDRDNEAAVRQHLATLSGAVNDSQQHVRLIALAQLGRFESQLAVTNIALQVGAEDTELRIAAIRALADTGHSSARPLLTSALGDPEPEVRREAIESLTRLQGAAARGELEQRLERERDPEVQEFLRTKLQQI